MKSWITSAFLCAALLFITPLQAQTAEQISKDTDRLIKVVEEMRGQKFTKPVPRKPSTEEYLVKTLEKEIEAEFNTDLIKAKVQSLKTVGLLPKDMDLMAQYVEILKDNVAGFYNPKNGTIYLMVRPGDKTTQLMSDTIIAHELTHALDDQLYGLEKMRKELPQDEDAQLAFTSVVEGSATVLMTRFMMKGMFKPGQALTEEDLQKIIEQDTKRAQSLLESPKYFLCTLLPPYVNGMHFTLRGWSPLFMMRNLDRNYAEEVKIMMKNPPRSMEQVLHPNKYWLSQMWDEPIKISDELAGALFAEQDLKIVHADTFGEMMMTALNWPVTKEVDLMALGKPNFWRSGSGTGWGGDRFFLLAPEDIKEPMKHPEKLKGLWLTVWDTENDRNEFMEKHAEHGPKIKGRVVMPLGKVGLIYGYGIEEAKLKQLVKSINSEAFALLNKGEFHGDFDKTLSRYQTEKQLLEMKQKDQEFRRLDKANHEQMKVWEKVDHLENLTKELHYRIKNFQDRIDRLNKEIQTVSQEANRLSEILEIVPQNETEKRQELEEQIEYLNNKATEINKALNDLKSSNQINEVQERISMMSKQIQEDIIEVDQIYTKLFENSKFLDKNHDAIKDWNELKKKLMNQSTTTQPSNK